MEQFKTYFFLTILTLFLVFIGGVLGGSTGALIAFIIAAGMNFYSYYYSDKLVLRHYKAKEVTRIYEPKLFNAVEKLVVKAGLPMPKVYVIPDNTPNAFATGRNPKNAAVAVTEGLLRILDEDEIAGVLAHELSHVKHYDILIGSVAATVAGAIAMIANFMQFSAMFGGNNRGVHPIVMIILALIMPLVATIIQMSISRNREFLADEGAARMTGHPEWLQSALSKLEQYSRGGLRDATPESAHMFIVNPLNAQSVNFSNLFRTHPTTEDRIVRLEEIKMQMSE